jgi:tetratricopeptide (TPR) repeat protein
MKQYLVIAAVTTILLGSCGTKEEAIADSRDYTVFMKSNVAAAKVKSINTEIAFWEHRLMMDTGSYVNMVELARYQLSLFKTSGNIASLHTGDSLLRRCSEKLNNTSPEILYSLSQNSITQHQFLRSAAYIAGAEKAKGDPYVIRLLQFDTYMELGRYGEAYSSLSSLKDKESFDYLIRRAKWEDHRGKLDEAIRFMETALQKVKGKNDGLYYWALSNLSDMYGHEGRVKDAYKGYLEVLKKDPSNLYCLKGIAWIAFSHDHNYAEAKRILHYILSQTAMPDLKLMLADIAEEEGLLAEKKQLLNEFLAVVTRPEYGHMYNKYLIHIYTEDTYEFDKALALSQQEINNRFTPETCSWLAWSYYKTGEEEKAVEMADKFVHNKTFEPEAVYHLACIYAANGNTKTAKNLLNECLKSGFELGPVRVKKIEAELNAL